MEAQSRTADWVQADVLASAAAGDELAFRRIIAAYHEDMRKVCVYVAGDDAIADEATQAAWLIAWRKIGSVRQPSSLRPWLVSVAVNEAKQLMRKGRRRSEMEQLAQAAAQPPVIDPATGVAAIDLRVAIDRLEPDDRALLAMRYGAGFNATELARATGRKPDAVRQRLKRLLDRLREDLTDA